MIRLARVELLRLRSRRAARWLTLVAVGVLSLIGSQAIHEATSTPGTQDWVFVEMMPEGAGIVGGVLAVYAFLVGSTYAGADWAAGTVQSLLTWEPRRIRVVVAKLVALTGWVLAAGVLLHVVLTTFAAVASKQGGSLAGVDAEFWADQLVAYARALGLGVVVGWIAFGIASLTRNTGAALGVGFVYFAILENLLRALAPWVNPFLIGNAIGVWIGGAMTVPRSRTETFEFTRPMAAAVLVAYAVAIVGVMTTMFSRRDVT